MPGNNNDGHHLRNYISQKFVVATTLVFGGFNVDSDSTVLTTDSDIVDDRRARFHSAVRAWNQSDKRSMLAEYPDANDLLIITGEQGTFCTRTTSKLG